MLHLHTLEAKDRNGSNTFGSKTNLTPAFYERSLFNDASAGVIVPYAFTKIAAQN